MVRLRPLVGLAVAGVCAWVWVDTSFADRSEPRQANAEVTITDLEAPPAEAAEPAVAEAAPAAAVAGSPEALAGINELSVQLTSLSADYLAGTIDCTTALNQCNQCVQTLDTQYVSCESMPVWQDCRNQCVEFQATLPCCEETVISDVLISEEIISEEICEPIPMAEECLPVADCCFGGSAGYGGCGGGGGGFGGGGGLLATGLGAAALAIGLDDDDSSSASYDGT